ncbi:MAG: alanine--tRNA ligase-related protein, partial [Oscillospiraceae bacterium]
FLKELCDTVIAENKSAYPELAEHQDYIKKIISVEEERFSKTIDQGMNVLNNLVDNIEKTMEKGKRILSGFDAFKLNDTFGFPIDLTKEIMAENNIEVDEENFFKELQKQRETARADRAAKSGSSWAADLFQDIDAEITTFVGYEKLSAEAKVLAISDGDEIVDAVSTDEGEKDDILVILDQTPFYAESGGQVADVGFITAEGLKMVVKNCHKTVKGYFVHTCTLQNGTLAVGTVVMADVDKKTRMATARNHTAGHLLQQALRDVLGLHVHQAGQLVNASEVRFDFTHFGATTEEELKKVEEIVNEKIFDAISVTTTEMSIKEAKSLGAMALFGEKYGNIVRVVDAKGFSVELCGGTHVTNSAQIGAFKILSESSVAAGIRRIEAVTGTNVLALLDKKDEILNEICEIYKVNKAVELPAKVVAEKELFKSVQCELDEIKTKLANSKIDGLFENAKEVKGVRIFSAYLDGTSVDALRKMAERSKEVAPAGVAVICGAEDEKITLVVACGKEA